MTNATLALHPGATASVPDRMPAAAPAGRAAMWWVIASEIVIFGGFIACYLLYRIRHPEWAAVAAHTSTGLGVANTLILVTSSLFAARAHQAADRGDADRASQLLSWTMVLAIAFLCVKSVEYTLKFLHGFTPGSHLFWGFYFGLTGLHIAHVVAGFTAMCFVQLQLDKRRNLHRVEMVGMYWHLVDLVWIFLFTLLYVVR